MKYDLIAVGGGPAGMMGAAAAAEKGLRVILLEKNDRLGRKLSITGNGRCNFTNNCDISSFMNNIVSNGKFLYASLSGFDNQRLILFFNSLGVKTKVEDNNRVFPASDRSGDIIQAMQKHLLDNRVEIRLNSRVKKILVGDKRVSGVQLNDDSMVYGENVLIATGGLSYRQTGSTGEGLKMAKALGHSIVTPRPALAPLVLKEEWTGDLQGLALSNVKVQMLLEKQIIAEQTGEMIFTHFGVSGPAILKISSFINKFFGHPLLIKVDLYPSLSIGSLDRDILEIFKANPGKHLKNVLANFVPQKMFSLINNLSEVDMYKQVDLVTKAERESLAGAFKSIALNVKGARPINEAIVTAGGVDTREIDPSTMESKIIKGLFFAGEVMDVDALTGGFNLQIAFSTGNLSGISVAHKQRGVNPNR